MQGKDAKIQQVLATPKYTFQPALSQSTQRIMQTRGARDPTASSLRQVWHPMHNRSMRLCHTGQQVVSGPTITWKGLPEALSPCVWALLSGAPVVQSAPDPGP